VAVYHAGGWRAGNLAHGDVLCAQPGVPEVPGEFLVDEATVGLQRRDRADPQRGVRECTAAEPGDGMGFHLPTVAQQDIPRLHAVEAQHERRQRRRVGKRLLVLRRVSRRTLCYT